MAYFCECGEKLKSIRLKGGSNPTGTTKRLSYKVLFVEVRRAYKCPNGCELKRVAQSLEML